MNDPQWSINHSFFKSDLKFITKQIVLCGRTQIYKGGNHIDTFGPSWSLLFVQENEAEVRNGSRWEKLSGSYVLFIPPFAVFEVRITPGLHRWTSVMSAIPLSEAPLNICYRPLGKDEGIPQTKNEVISYFKKLRVSGQIINEQRLPSAVAERILIFQYKT